ncbi:hypothetical protein DdX_20960 [Ditylenchus destructor]|uniref:Uncharacterized protein n=1 Tax=Ditylenchus destructor TaxID=166010 RepID=A0AAD4QW33_9BILA|nr:hypothetical protein DdX_20960 [Ditylenchus destructor]
MAIALLRRIAALLLPGAALRRGRRSLRCLGRGRSCGVSANAAALDDLVELAAVEPDAPALRAVVDLDPLPIAHVQAHLAYGAQHSGNGFSGSHRILLW